MRRVRSSEFEVRRTAHRTPSIGRRVCPEPLGHWATGPLSRGFTLIELLVVIVIFGVIMGALLIAFLVTNMTYRSGDAYVHVQQEARRALHEVGKELREARGSASGVPNGAFVISAGGQQLDFQVALGYNLAVPCPANAVCWGAQDAAGTNQPGWSIRYRLVQLPNTTWQMVREIINAPPGGGGTVQGIQRVLANDVLPASTSFAWTGGATQTFTIQLEIRVNSSQLPGGMMSSAVPILRSDVRLRNPGS